MENMIGAIVLGIVSIVCFVFSYLQFNEKGFYIYMLPSKKEKLWIKSHIIGSQELFF